MGNLILIFSIVVISFVMKSYSAQNDITFILDTSDGISAEQLSTTIDFIYDVTSMLAIGPGSNRVAVVTFNDIPTTQFDLNNHTEKSSLLNAIDSLRTRTISGSRNPSQALTYVDENIYTDPIQGTPVVLLFMHGAGASPVMMTFVVWGLNHITRYVIGIGAFVTDSTKTPELEDAASDPDSDHLYLLQGFSELCNISSEIALKLDVNATSTGNHTCSSVNTSDQTTVDIIETTSSESLQKNTFKSTVSTTTMDTTTKTTALLTSATTQSVQTPFVTENIQSSSDIDSSMFTTIIGVLIGLIVAVFIILLSSFFILKYRKRSKMVDFLTMLVHEYPDIKNGPGPSKQRYRRHQVHKNVHSKKFHSYLKLSMMANGINMNHIKTVSR